ncbi:hypothetical protein [Novipirellula sp.]
MSGFENDVDAGIFEAIFFTTRRVSEGIFILARSLADASGYDFAKPDDPF